MSLSKYISSENELSTIPVPALTCPWASIVGVDSGLDGFLLGLFVAAASSLLSTLFSLSHQLSGRVSFKNSDIAL